MPNDDLIEWTDATGRKWSLRASATGASIGAPETVAMRAEPLSLRDQNAVRVMVKGPRGTGARWLPVPPEKGAKPQRPRLNPDLRAAAPVPCLCGVACETLRLAAIIHAGRLGAPALFLNPMRRPAPSPCCPAFRWTRLHRPPAIPPPVAHGTATLVARMVAWYAECAAHAASMDRRARLAARGFKLPPAR